MAPPKGLAKWKTKFFYVKVAAITVRLQFRNVTDTIITENISLPRADKVDWFSDLRIIGWVKLDNTQLWVLRIIGWETPLWIMFCLDFKGKVVVLPCEDGEEGFNVTIRDNFWVPAHAALELELPQAKV
ncbi:hypothetical protein Hanom_Chr04g00317241 [Helianthus anomalus]